MFFHFLWLFTFIGLPLQGITPQQILLGAQQLYESVRNKDAQHSGENVNVILRMHSKMYINKVKLLEQARDIAKERKDTGGVQDLTERIIEAKKNFWERHPIICTGLLVGLCSYLNYRVGRYREYCESNLWN